MTPPLLLAAALAATIPLRNPFWPVGYSGEREPISEEPRFEVNYTITQAETGANLLVRTPVSEAENTVPSMVPVWRSANWLEREQYDLMGIEFAGHPDLRRIMMWEGYPYHPLRKDFPVAGKDFEQAGVAFTQKAPTGGAPFTTTPGVKTAGEREPRSRG